MKQNSKASDCPASCPATVFHDYLLAETFGQFRGEEPRESILPPARRVRSEDLHGSTRVGGGPETAAGTPMSKENPRIVAKIMNGSDAISFMRTGLSSEFDPDVPF